MSINICTTIQHDYSFIEAVAVQMGSDVLEDGDYAVNGVGTPYLGGGIHWRIPLCPHPAQQEEAHL